MKTAIFYIGCLFFVSLVTPSFGQNQDPCYIKLKKEGKDLFRKKEYENAINKYLAALNCDSINQIELADLIEKAQQAREAELIAQRTSAEVNALTAQSILAYKGEKNPTKACRLAFQAWKKAPTILAPWGAFLDAYYSQVFFWKDDFYSVPMSRTYRQTGILGTADLSLEGQILATGSWEPPIVKLWPLNKDQDTLSLLGFTDVIWQLCFSPDGQSIAVASLDGNARVYGRNGEVKARLFDHRGPVFSIAFSNDGQKVITASQDSTAIVWNVNDGGSRYSLLSLPSSVRMASFSRDDSLIITACEDGTASIWDGEGELKFTIQHGLAPLSSASFSMDGQKIITTSRDGTTKIWSSYGLLIKTIHHESEIAGVALAADSSRFATYSKDGIVKISDWDGQIINSFQAHTQAVNGAHFSPDSKHLLTFSSDGLINIWDSSGKLVLSLGEFTGPVLAANFSKDGNTIFASSWDNSAKIFHLTENPLVTFSGLKGNIRKAIISHDGRQLVAISLGGEAIIWRSDGEYLKNLHLNAGWFYDIVVNSSWSTALIKSDGGAILWNIENNTWQRLPHDHVSIVKFFPDGKRMLTASKDGSIKIWNSTGDSSVKVVVERQKISDVAISPSGMLIATGHDDGTVALWSVKENKALWTHQYHSGKRVNSVSFSHDGKFILSASDENRAFLWNLRGEPENVYKHAGSISNALFSSDDKKILTYSTDGMAKYWQKDATHPTAIFQTPSAVNCAIFSKDHKFIITASNDGIIRLWGLNGTLLASFIASERSINDLVLSPTGDWLVSVASDGRIHRWNLNLEQFPKNFLD